VKIGWKPVHQAGSHVKLRHSNYPYPYTWAFHDGEELGPKMLARIARRTGLTPEDLRGPSRKGGETWGTRQQSQMGGPVAAVAYTTQGFILFGSSLPRKVICWRTPSSVFTTPKWVSYGPQNKSSGKGIRATALCQTITCETEKFGS